MLRATLQLSHILFRTGDAAYISELVAMSNTAWPSLAAIAIIIIQDVVYCLCWKLFHLHHSQLFATANILHAKVMRLGMLAAINKLHK